MFDDRFSKIDCEVIIIDQIQFLGSIANIATCITLILYIIGNLLSGLIAYIHADKTQGEIFIWNPPDRVIQKYDAINYETSEDNNGDSLFISTDDMILDIKVYELIYNNDRLNKGKVLFSYDRLFSRECILFSTAWVESYPTYLIEWETPSFMKASLQVSYNNKNNENIKYKHTISSAIFYFFQKN